MDWNEVEFKNEKRWLSNMFPTSIIFDAPQEIKDQYPMFSFDKELYKSSEHLYQALKTNDEEIKAKIREIDRPETVKSFARKIKLREDFLDVRLKAMEIAIFLKFTQNEELKQKLKEYNEPIIERNDWKDSFWGVYKGKGENNLGILLTNLKKSL